MVPEPTLLGTHDINDDNRQWQLEATLVRVETFGTQNVHVAKHFGPGNVPRDDTHCLAGQMPPCYVPDETHSNCDFNHSGKIDFTDPQESACADACAGSCSAAALDLECSEWSQFESQSDFELIVTDSSDNSLARFQANASAANLFDPVAYRGQTIHSFTGLLAYFSGGCQFTSNARCQDDIVVDMNSPPIPSDQACVHPRTLSDINASSQ